MSKTKNLLALLAAMMLFIALVATIFYTVKTGVIPFQMGLLLFIFLLGMYMGFGILIGAYRLVHKLN